ncbi:hypothetical protein ACH4FA_20980 [Streptomyces sp. NPDC017966]|uniref:hypothetical protein n=1 Tax=unclassified Streptomyces TaxID=2593676 RepID=UPI001C23A4FF|nr:hypothetical protein [Streptomyces sp. AC558_RSS880]
MNPRGNTLKLTAVSALVVLTLTGFSTGRGGSGGSGDGSGGGCSSSDQNHDSSSSSGGGSHRDYDDDDDHDTSGGGSGNASASVQDATVELVTCASEASPHATVEVTNPNATDGVFTVTVIFEDTAGAEVATRTQDVDVPANDTATVRVDVGDDTDVTLVAECDPGLYAPAAR